MKTNDIQLSAPDYFQNKETIDINVKPSSVKLSSLTLEGQAKIARDQSGFKPFNPKSYEKILGHSDVNPTLDLEDLNEYRALQQSGWRLLGSSVGNTLTTFVGDAISAVGASLNLPRSTYHLISRIWDDNAAEKWNNIVNKGLGAALMEAGDEIGQWGKNVMPIYKTKAAEAGIFNGGLTDATWWAEAGPTIGNVAAMLIPYAGQAKLLSYIGKALRTINTASKLGKLASTVGTALRSSKVNHILMTLQGAHTDAILETTRGWQTQYDYAKSLGYSDEEANKFASVYAAESYKRAVGYGLLFNAIEMQALLRGVNKSPVTPSRIQRGIQQNIEAIKKGGSKATLTKLEDVTETIYDKFLKSGNFALDLTKGVISEGAEEMATDFALSQGEGKAKDYLGIEHYNKYRTSLDQLGTFLKDGKNWDTFFWGAFGGLTMPLSQKAISKVLNGDAEQKYEETRAQNIIDLVQSTQKLLEDYNGDMSVRIEQREVKDKDGNILKDENGDIITESVYVDPFSQLMPNLLQMFGDTNAYQYVESFLESLNGLSKEEQTELYGEDKSEVIGALRREFDIAQQAIVRAKGLSWNSDYDHYGQQQVAIRDYMKNYYDRQSVLIDTQIKELTMNRENYWKTLESIDNKRAKLDQHIEQLTSDISNQEDILKSHKDKISKLKRSKKYYTNRILKLEQDNLNIENEIRVLNNDISRLENQKVQLSRKSFRKSKKNQSSTLFDDTQYRQDLIDINNQIETLKNKVDDLNTTISNNNVKRAEIETISEVIDKDINNHNDSIEYANAKINQLNQLKSKVNTEVLALTSERDSKTIAYEQKQSELIGQNSRFNTDLNGLYELKRLVDIQRAEIDNTIEHQDEIIPKHLKQIEEAEKKAEEELKVKEIEEKKLQKQAEKKQKREEKEPEDTIPTESDDYSITSGKDSNNIDFTKGLNEAVKSIKISGVWVRSGNILNVNGKPRTIEKIGISDNTLQVYLQGDTEPISAKTLVDANTSVMDINEVAGYNGLIGILNKYNRWSTDSLTQPNKLKRIEDIHNFVNEILETFINSDGTIKTDSALYMLITQELTNTEAVDVLVDFLIKTRNKLTQSKYIDYKKNEIDTVITFFNGIIKKANNQRNKIVFKQYLKNTLDYTKISIEDPMYNTYHQYLNSIVDDIINIITNNGFNISEKNRLSLIDLNKIPLNTQLMVLQAINRYKTEMGVKLDLSSDIIDEINDDLTKLYDAIKNSLKNVYLNLTQETIRNAQVNNLRAQLKSVIENDVELKQAIEYHQEVKDLLNNIENYFNTNAELLKTQYVKNDIDNASKINTLINNLRQAKSKIPSLTDSNGDIRGNIFTTLPTELGVSITNKLHTLIQSLESSYQATDITIKATGFGIDQILMNNRSEDTVVQLAKPELSNIVKTIDVLNNVNIADLSSDLDNIQVESRTDDATRKINYYLSPNTQRVLQSVHDILLNIEVDNFYSRDNGKITFEVLLDYMLQETGSKEKVMDVANNLYVALSLITNPLYRDTLEALFVKKGIDKQDPLYKTYKTVVENVELDVDTRKYTSHGNLTPAYLRHFFETHEYRDFEARKHTGLRRLNPSIYSVISDEKYYDKAKRQFRENIKTINVEGEEFTPKQIINALKSLHDGQVINYDNKGSDIHVWIEVDGKKLVIEKIPVTDNLTYGGFNLKQTTPDGRSYYHSVFDTLQPGQPIHSFIKSMTTGGVTPYNTIREFYKLYNKYRTAGTVEEHSEELLNLINSLEGNQSKDYCYNALRSCVTYDLTKNEQDSFTNFTKDDLEKIYYIVSPMFYKVRSDMIDRLERNEFKISSAYRNLNGKLQSDFNETIDLISDINSGENTLILSGINKTSVAYAGSKTLNDINSTVEKTTTINDRPAVDIIVKQYIPNESAYIVSSLTTGEILSRESEAVQNIKDNHNWQVYVKIKANENENGTSLIPTIRGTLRMADNLNSKTKSYLESANQVIVDNLFEIIENVNMTDLNTKGSSNNQNTGRNALNLSEKEAQQYTEYFSDILDTMSKHIVIDSDRKGFFNVGTVFKNISTEEGKSDYYVKTINFITSIPTPGIGNNRAISYMNTITCYYNDDLTLRQIKIHRNSIDTKTRNIRDIKSQIRGLEGDLVKKSEKDNSYTITINNKNRAAIKEIFKKHFTQNMFRSLNTHWNQDNNSVKSISYAESKSNISVGIDISMPYTDIAGNTYNSYQDFLLDTGAIRTSLEAVKSANGEVLTNYTIDAIPPAMYFKTQTSQSREDFYREMEESKSEVNDETINDEKLKIEAQKVYPKLDNIIKSDKAWFETLGSNQNDRINSLKVLGIIPNNIDDSIAKDIHDWLKEVYKDGTKLTWLNIENDNDNTLAEYNNPNNTIDINPKWINRITTNYSFGRVMLHESIHKALRQNTDVAAKAINTSYDLIQPYFEDAINSTLDEFNNKYNSNLTQEEFENFKKFADVINKTHEEIITYSLTDSIFANILNKIKTQEVISKDNNVKKSLWRKIVDILLEVIGVKPESGSLYETLVNNIYNQLNVSANKMRVVGDQPSSPTGSDATAGSMTTNETTTVEDNGYNPDKKYIFDEIPFAIDVLSETANTEMGYTPALTTFENSFENTLKSNENFVSSQIDLIQDFKNKYYDETNTKIC